MSKKERKICEFEMDLKNFFVCALRAYLHKGGGPQAGEVTCVNLPHLTCKRDHIKIRDYLDRRVTPPKRVTSPTWGPPPPCKQALSGEGGNKPTSGGPKIGSALVPSNHSPDDPEPTNGSVNSKRAHPPHPGHLSAIGHLVGSGRGEFVRNLCPGGGAFVNSSRSS